MPENNAEAETAPSMEDVSYCPVCGAMRKDKEHFCAVCGHNYNAASEAAEPQIITRPVYVQRDDNSDEAPMDYDAE